MAEVVAQLVDDGLADFGHHLVAVAEAALVGALEHGDNCRTKGGGGWAGARREPILADTQRLEEFLPKNFARR